MSRGFRFQGGQPKHHGRINYRPLLQDNKQVLVTLQPGGDGPSTCLEGHRGDISMAGSIGVQENSNTRTVLKYLVMYCSVVKVKVEVGLQIFLYFCTNWATQYSLIKSLVVVPAKQC